MRVCKWHPNDSDHSMASHSEWPWQLCPICDDAVHQRARQIVRTGMPVTYPEFGDLVPNDVKNKGGFWQYDVLSTLSNHHRWIRHTRRDMRTWDCGLSISDTHFHPPST